MKFFLFIIICLIKFSILNYANAEINNNKADLKIIVTIKPLYNLVAAVINGVPACKAELLLRGNVSPHDYALKLSDLNLLNDADLIVWGGEDLEFFLIKLLKQAKFYHKLFTIQQLSGLRKLTFRNSGYLDEHLWLSPYNAKIIVLAIEQHLSKLDPKNANLYKINRKKFLIKLGILDAEIKAKMKLSSNKTYLVFHDAYQYFEKFYDLRSPVVISDNPAMPLSMKRMLIIRELIDNKKGNCLFKEPQFSSKALDSLINSYDLNHQIKIGILDPLGSDQDLGAEGYFKLISNLADSFYNCFRD